MLTIAHRAGNSLATLRAALESGVDLVETDVRYFRGELEVRHLKSLGPTLLWDHPWELVRRRDARVASLADVLQLAGRDGRLLLDLKGIDPRLAPAVAATVRSVAPGAPVAVCTRHWRMLDAFATDTAVRLVPSAGSAAQLRRLLTVISRPVESWPGGRRAFGVSIKRTLLTTATVTALHRAVGHVLAWAVDAPWELEQAAGFRVDGVISKNLPMLGEIEDGWWARP